MNTLEIPSDPISDKPCEEVDLKGEWLSPSQVTCTPTSQLSWTDFSPLFIQSLGVSMWLNSYHLLIYLTYLLPSPPLHPDTYREKEEVRMVSVFRIVNPALQSSAQSP